MNQPSNIARLVQDALPKMDDPPVEHSLQQQLVEFWMHNIGSLATNCYPILFQSGRMVVICNSPVWTTQLRNMVPSLIRQLGEAGFNVRVMEIKTSPGQIHNKPAIRNYPAVEKMSGDNAKAMDLLSDKLSHNALGAALKKLSKKHQ